MKKSEIPNFLSAWKHARDAAATASNAADAAIAAAAIEEGATIAGEYLNAAASVVDNANEVANLLKAAKTNPFKLFTVIGRLFGLLTTDPFTPLGSRARAFTAKWLNPLTPKSGE